MLLPVPRNLNFPITLSLFVIIFAVQTSIGKPSSRPYRLMAVCLARGDTLDLARADAIRASKKITVVSNGS